MNKIGVVGDSDSVIGFKSLGIDVYPATDGEVIKTINRLAQSGYAIIFVTEQAAEIAAETIDRYKTLPFPAIIPIPGNRGTTGLGMRGINANVEKAIGINILGDD
ncbi:MAG: V-type ATP synthase subunit F [Christensenellales bacterium]|jgi:V/A-type H+-transporting ATPase subunit F